MAIFPKKKLLKRLYLDEDMTAKQIAKQLKCTENEVKSALNRHEVRKEFGQQTKSRQDLLLTDVSLRFMHQVRLMSYAEMAKEIGISATAVSKHFERKGIPYDKTAPQTRRELSKLREDWEHIGNVWSDLTPEQREKFIHKTNVGRLGLPHSQATKDLMKLTGALNVSGAKDTKAEKLVAKLLEKNNIRFQKKRVVVLFDKDKKLIGAYCVDFLLHLPIEAPGGDAEFLEVVLEVDSRYHHTLPKISTYDRKRDAQFLSAGLNVIRVWHDECTWEKIGNLINDVMDIGGEPSLFRYKYPKKYLKKCPKKFAMENLEQEILPRSLMVQHLNYEVKLARYFVVIDPVSVSVKHQGKTLLHQLQGHLQD